MFRKEIDKDPNAGRRITCNGEGHRVAPWPGGLQRMRECV
jgi:hypothetical protein